MRVHESVLHNEIENAARIVVLYPSIQRMIAHTTAFKFATGQVTLETARHASDATALAAVVERVGVERL